MPVGESGDQYAILFVDDEEKARKYFRVAFSLDFPVLTASGVAEALGILERQGDEIGVLVSDQRMPGQKGVDLLRRAREDWPSIVRILTTAYSDLDDAIAAVNSGEILRYITKPWDIDSLRAELKHAMEFFLLRHERNLLMGEKISVRHRMVHRDRLRNLLVITAGLDHLRYAEHAVAAWVRDTLEIFRGVEASTAQLELWGLDVAETVDMISAHRSLRELDSGLEVGFPDRVDVAEIARGAGLKVGGGVHEISGRRALLRRMIGDLAAATDGRGTARFSGASLADGSNGLMLTMSCSAQTFSKSVAHDLPSNADEGGLLDAYLIACHHGGELHIDLADERLRVELTLPADPETVALPPMDASWISSQFSMLEGW